jgi:hypothetical protein
VPSRRAPLSRSRPAFHLIPPRPLAAVLLAAVLALGSVAHAWHHVVDRDCEGASGPHPCTQCAGLHSGAVVATALVTTAPTPSAPGAVALRILAAPAATSRVACSPRAPPRG